MTPPAHVTLLLDLDGTLLDEDTPVPGAVSVVASWVERGHRLCYATNDAVCSRDEQRRRLARAGFPTRDRHGPAPVVTAASVTAAALVSRAPRRRALRVLLVGAPAVRVEVGAAPIRFVTSRPDVLVVGLDTGLTYTRLAQAVTALDAGAAFLATNRDAAFRTAAGERRPGAGAIVAAIEVASGRTATLLGKPGPRLFAAALREAEDGASRGLGAAALREGEGGASRGAGAVAPLAPDSAGVGRPIVVVGDSSGDIAAGRALGACCIRVGGRAACAVDADLVVPSIADLRGVDLPPSGRCATPLNTGS